MSLLETGRRRRNEHGETISADNTTIISLGLIIATKNDKVMEVQE